MAATGRPASFSLCTFLAHHCCSRLHWRLSPRWRGPLGRFAVSLGGLGSAWLLDDEGEQFWPTSINATTATKTCARWTSESGCNWTGQTPAAKSKATLSPTPSDVGASQHQRTAKKENGAERDASSSRLEYRTDNRGGQGGF
ncbi:uncharacterized protein BKA78DRAFT_92453 [Phyllosticta capitalensis]|uniref:uncharacterized protein n=1 Tax=Phyllosticta capitalensis TaxID=121624 RepID=UPI00312FE35F